MSDKANESAFPVAAFTAPNGEIVWGENGLTKREWLAGMALQGLLHDSTARFVDGNAARLAVKHADELLAALADGKEGV